MTFASPSFDRLAASRRPPSVMVASVAIALLAAAVVSAPMAGAVWRTGLFADSDDVMRLAQVRDLMQGQGWFDMTARRLDPPQGVFMHWSRVIDAPLAALIAVFNLFVGPETAERLARLVFPLTMLGALFAAMAAAGRLLVGGRGVWAGVLIGFLGGPMFGQFQPGRIDHHAPQIVLLVAAFLAMAAAFEAARARLAALAGLAIAASLAISLENLPFIVLLAAAPALAFVLRGESARGLLYWFATGLAAGLPALYAATIAPGRWGLAFCDALSIAQLAPALAYVALCFALARFAPRLTTVAARLAVAAGAGLAILGCYVAAFPDCLGDPLVATDPLVRQVWLSQVREAMPWTRLARMQPDEALSLAVPTGLGLFAAAALAVTGAGVARARWALLAALILAGLALGAWQIRAFSSVLPLAGLGVLGGVSALAERGARRHALAGGPLAMLALLVAASPIGWTIAAAPGAPAETPAEPRADKMACFSPENVRALDALTPGLALTHIDVGPFVIGQSRHSVLAGPYHRDNHGNRAMIEAWREPEQTARARLAALGVRYVFFCPGASDAATLVGNHADSLMSRLEAGRPPAWLIAEPLAAGPYRAYAIAPDPAK